MLFVTSPVTELVERVNNREISLQTERDGHVDTASHTGLGQGQAVGHQVGPHGGGVVRAQLGQGEGQEGGDQEPGVYQGQDEHQPAPVQDHFSDFSNQSLVSSNL